MLTVAFSDPDEFVLEMRDNAGFQDIARKEIRITASRQMSVDPKINVVTFMCTYECAGLLYLLEVPCGRILQDEAPTDDHPIRKLIMKLEGKFKDAAEGIGLKLRGGLLQVRLSRG